MDLPCDFDSVLVCRRSATSNGTVISSRVAVRRQCIVDI